ncbi:hypothetical protein CHS0354_015410, partial [Potamilus streckersoni]
YSTVQHSTAQHSTVQYSTVSPSTTISGRYSRILGTVQSRYGSVTVSVRYGLSTSLSVWEVSKQQVQFGTTSVSVRRSLCSAISFLQPSYDNS